MAKSKVYVGLEIGTSKTCMVVGVVKPDSSVKILGLGESKSVGVRRGEISDYNQVKACLKEALLDAEHASDIEISNVCLSVTGGHIMGVNNRGTFRLPETEREVTQEHIEEAKEIAQDIVLPHDHVGMHDFGRQFWLDDKEYTTPPLGLVGAKLESEYHVVHGMGNRLQNSLKCVRETPLEIDMCVFAPIATAHVALGGREKREGALVIDMGGGTTDYVLFLNGVPVASGCIPMGGDNVTNDIHLVAKIPFSSAEALKKTEGDASGDPARSVGRANLPEDNGFREAGVDRKLLNGVIRARLKEALDSVKGRLPEGSLERIGTGVFLAGGCSQMRGLAELVEETFGLDVYHSEQNEMSGVHAYFRDPQYSTAVGLIRYAQIMEGDRLLQKRRSTMRQIVQKVWPF